MMKPGDKVRVRIDTNGGWHGLVGTRGYYADTVRATGTEGDRSYVVLTEVSWAPPEDCEPTDSNDAEVEVGGRTYRIRMLDRGKVWWAKLPRSLEPLACEATYSEALHRAVESLWRSNEERARSR